MAMFSKIDIYILGKSKIDTTEQVLIVEQLQPKGQFTKSAS